MRHSPIALGFSLAILSNVIVVARAHAPSHDAIPRDLVEGLLNGCGCGNGRVVVGAPAPDLPAELIPERGEVLGSLLGEGSTTVVQVSDPDGAAVTIEKRAVDAGWRQPAPFSYAGGFVPAYEMRPTVLCRDGRNLTLSASTASDGTGVLRMSLWRGDACDRQGARYQGPGPDLPLPVLRVPPAARMSGGGSSGGEGYTMSSARITFRQPPADLLDHFASEIEQAGWKAIARASAADLDVRIFETLDSQHRRLKGVLSAVMLAEHQYQLEFEVLHAPAPE